MLKTFPEPREVQFYTEVSAHLDAAVALPEVSFADQTHLLLEHIDSPLPPHRWLADPSVMQVLAALHRSKEAAARVVDPVRPVWSPDLTTALLHLLPVDDRRQAGAKLDGLRRESRYWLDGDVLCSGGTGRRNWGLRGGNDPVLLDWSTIALSTPALDVAGTVPGLPTRDQLELTANAYLNLQRRDHVHWSAEVFTRGLAVVTAWRLTTALVGGRVDVRADGAADAGEDGGEDAAAAVLRWLRALP